MQLPRDAQIPSAAALAPQGLPDGTLCGNCEAGDLELCVPCARASGTTLLFHSLALGVSQTYVQIPRWPFTAL